MIICKNCGAEIERTDGTAEHASGVLAGGYDFHSGRGRPPANRPHVSVAQDCVSCKSFQLSV